MFFTIIVVVAHSNRMVHKNLNTLMKNKRNESKKQISITQIINNYYYFYAMQITPFDEEKRDMHLILVFMWQIAVLLYYFY